ncbi:MAG: sce7726 family protein [Chloroflexi bacterium]|nr:sce7726 family protein [Chloroflexota bacterium]
MNDPQIRSAFHQTFLKTEHFESNTLIVDELGIKHGKCRADIAVINKQLNGFEIKSDNDSLTRLMNQIEHYNTIFDYISIIVVKRHLKDVMHLIPTWWGVILVESDQLGKLYFREIRSHHRNETVNDYSVAQLLWHNEAQEILIKIGVQGAQLREKRSNLYMYLIENLPSQELRSIVREYLKKRRGWRDHERLFLYDDSFPPNAR